MANRLVDNQVQKGFVASGRDIKVDSKVAEEVIPFGKGLKRGTDGEKQVLVWDGIANTDLFCGFAKETAHDGFEDNQANQYAPVAEFRGGEIYLEIDANSGGVTAGEKVAVLPSGDVDAVSNLSTGTGGTYAVEIGDSEFKQAGNAGDYVVAEVDLPCDLTVTQLA